MQRTSMTAGDSESTSSAVSLENTGSTVGQHSVSAKGSSSRLKGYLSSSTVLPFTPLGAPRARGCTMASPMPTSLTIALGVTTSLPSEMTTVRLTERCGALRQDRTKQVRKRCSLDQQYDIKTDHIDWSSSRLYARGSGSGEQIATPSSLRSRALDGANGRPEEGTAWQQENP